MEDREIIQLYFDRNEEAIRQTEQQYGHYCFTVAYHILFDRDDSEECVNDTWLKTWQLIPPQRPKYLKYFLAKITRGFAVNRLRTKTRDKRGGSEADIALEELENVLSSGSDPEKEYDRKELGRLISRFLSREKKQDAALFVRRYFYAESVRIIAQQYGMSENTVSLRLSRMREKLKEELTKEGYL